VPADDVLLEEICASSFVEFLLVSGRSYSFFGVFEIEGPARESFFLSHPVSQTAIQKLALVQRDWLNEPTILSDAPSHCYAIGQSQGQRECLGNPVQLYVGDRLEAARPNANCYLHGRG
jgi:hypothetical protein